jgi:hypothetical protein
MASPSSWLIGRWWSRNRTTSWLVPKTRTCLSWLWATPLGGLGHPLIALCRTRWSRHNVEPPQVGIPTLAKRRGIIAR